MDKHKHLRDKRFIYGTLRRYTPCSGRFISLVRTPQILGDIRTVEVHGQRVSVCVKPIALFRWGGHLWTEEPLLDRLKYEIEISKEPWCLGLATSDYVWDPTDSHILIEESLNKLQRVLDVEYIRFTADSFFRTTERTAVFQSELRAICKCKTIKEELMAETWHPRRVERILETYGWDAYNNLLGEE
jgi:hypothetical protein